MPVKKPARKKDKKFSQKRLREIMWKIGQKKLPPSQTDHIALLMIHPHSGHVYWNMTKESLRKVVKRLKGNADHASLVVRVYDVTDLIFDGLNAHAFFDLEVGEPSGNYYFKVDEPGRNFLAEAGLRCRDGSFHYIARSGTTFFDHDHPSGNYRADGLFVKGVINRTFPVQNIFDAHIYEEMNREIAVVKRKKRLSVAEVLLDINSGDETGNPLESIIEDTEAGLKTLGVSVHLFSSRLRKTAAPSLRTLIERVSTSSQRLYTKLSGAHKKSSFHIVHCHDWYSSKVGVMASKKLGLPMVLTLHSTEYERAGDDQVSRVSTKIKAVEKEAVQEAAMVIAPNASMRDRIISAYGAVADKVIVMPHVTNDNTSALDHEIDDVLQSCGLNQQAPVVLFAGEMSHAAGADIMVDALPTVHRNHAGAQFVFAGDGPLKGELEARAWHTGIGHNCRFPGNVSSSTFEALLLACDFVVIPARTWQDDGAARMAIERGRPVLTTQQSGIRCIKHGENGLVTFDNPGSIVWGIQELLSNPLNESMLKLTAKRNAGESVSGETIAALHYMYYERVLKSRKRGARG
jgi:glycosyltransferase involved in cell wall biosynthesis